jgi:hypothetical protein
MKKALILSFLLLALASLAVAKSRDASIQPFPKTLINAKYVYVTSYDGDQYNPNLLPDDRNAIANVQDAIQKWGHYILVYRPDEADIVLMVQSRPSEDVLAVYDGKEWPSGQTWLWRAMGSSGLQKGETPLVTQLQQAFERASK